LCSDARPRALFSAVARLTDPQGSVGGYSDFMIASDTMHVKFQGSDLSSPDRVFQLLLKRCADLTLQQGSGISRPRIGPTNPQLSRSLFRVRSIRAVRARASTARCTAIRLAPNGSENTIVRPSSTLNLNRPAGGMTIKMGNDQLALASARGHRVFESGVCIRPNALTLSPQNTQPADARC
jgi:hypothetical protein